MSDLGGIARILEQHEIMRVETDRSVFFASVVQVLTDVHDAGVVVMRSLREQVGDSAVSFPHQIVDYQKRPSAVEQIRTGQTFDEFDAIRKFVEQFALEFTVTPHYSFGRLVDHRVQVFQELCDKMTFAALTRTDDHVRARMTKTDIEVHESFHSARARNERAMRCAFAFISRELRKFLS